MRFPPALPFLAAVLAATTLVLAGCGGDDDNESTAPSDQDKAVAAAKRIFSGSAQSIDLSSGPCISESLPGLPDWVADVAHDPREDVDDDPANQCQRYRDGEADHFVELTPEGELIRAE
jgi:hypothetical protein